MTELEVTESDSAIVEEARSVEALPDHVGQDVRNVLPEMGAEEQANSLDEEEVAIVMEIAEVIERGRKDRSLALRNVPKKKLLVSLKHIVLQRLMNCSMQELLLLQID